MGSCCYDREYFVIPYQSNIDKFEIDLSKAEQINVKYVTTNIVKIDEHKKPYVK